MSRAKDICGFMRRKLKLISDAPENRQKAVLAEFRRGLGKQFCELPELAGFILDNMPEEWMSHVKEPSREEQAIYQALTLYALHQQGHDVNNDNMHKEGVSIGQAIASLSSESEEITRIQKRFSIILASSDIDGLTYYLRGMIQMLRKEKISFDYSLLVEDLYKYQFPESVQEVRLSWTHNYYKELNKIQKEEEQNE